MSQARVAEKIGVAPESVTQWEIGSTTPTTDHLQKFAKALRLTMERFYGETPPPAKRPKRRAA
jgi:transcriptional regulator with XRE-family HTH domain